jgi:cobyrinic acid a,c-diamide synthase
MSVPRVLLAPTHRTGLADAIAAATAEVLTDRGQQVRYHHLAPQPPSSCWDRWEGTAFLDPGLYPADSLLALYDVATRGAGLSLLSSDVGLLDRRDGVSWVAADVARTLDCPVVLVVDCRGWGTSMRALAAGIRSASSGVNLAGVILTGVAGGEHLDLLRPLFLQEHLPVVGCLFVGDGPEWDTPAPGAWGLPLDASLQDAVSRQVDLKGLTSVAGQRGFLPPQNTLIDRGADGPIVAVAGGKGFGLWSRDSVEVLRAAGAQVRRLDLIEDPALPEGTAGLVLAGTVWPAALPDIAMNTALLGRIRAEVERGMPTLALGGGELILLNRVQDLLGRTSDLAGVIAAEGEILWDLDAPVYVAASAGADSVLLERGEALTGWVLTDAEVVGEGGLWDSPLMTKGDGQSYQAEDVASGSVLCSRTLFHLAATPGMAPRFVRRCAAFAARRS